MSKLMAIVDAIRAVRKLDDKEMKEAGRTYGLSPVEARILIYLYNHPYEITAQDIADGRSIPKGMVSAGVDSLVGKGYLTRSMDSEDRRKIHLIFTEKGRALAIELRMYTEKLFQIIFRGFSSDEIETLLSYMSRLYENAEENL